MKPDVSAPGSLYSSLPNSTYQTWPGTSMAAPYMAGIIALWKESVLRQGIVRPRAGWVAAANTAFKNTARPLPYRGSDKLMWPPVKVGAGVVQAHNAIINNITIAPTELLVRTDVTSQRFALTVRNRGQADATYRLSHKPAVSVSLAHAWYGDGFDADLPTAHMLVVDKVITVPAGQTVTVDVSLGVGWGGPQLLASSPPHTWPLDAC
jgi:subtilisin family serine protease